MRTIWIVVAAYAVLYALTVVISGDATVMVAGLLIGLVILLPVTFFAVRGKKTPAGDRPLGDRQPGHGH